MAYNSYEMVTRMGQRFFMAALCLLMTTSTLSTTYSRVACRYYDKQAKHKTPRMRLSLPIIDARSENMKSIQVTGIHSDGFFLVDKVFTGNREIPLNSADEIKRYCENALRHRFKDKADTKVLLSFGIRKSALSLKLYPVVFEQLTKEDQIDRMVIFGDSLSDQGNLKHRLPLILPRDYFAGRFTDGPNWPDYLGKMSSLSIYNLAVGGSVSRKFKNFHFSSHRLQNKINVAACAKISGSLHKQVKRYHKHVLNNGVVHHPHRTAFTIWIGGNDYINPLNEQHDADIFIDQPDHPRIGSNTVVRHVINNIILNMEELYRLGARRFVIINLADMGVMPKIPNILHFHSQSYKSAEDKTVTLSRALTAITKHHNALLKQRLEEFKKNHTDGQVIEVNAFAHLQTVVWQSTKLLSKNLRPDFAMEYGPLHNPVIIHKACYYGGLFGSKKHKWCQEKGLLFADEIHPSSLTHCLFSYFIHHDMAQHKLMNPENFDDYRPWCSRY